jgi:flap endonuclease-1
MGVMLKDIVPKEDIVLEALSGKKIAIDALNSLYQFLAIIRQRDGTPRMDSKGRITSHLSGVLYRTCKLLQAGIKPIYVFDGEPPILKREVLEERKEIRKTAKEKWEKAKEVGDFIEARKYAQASMRITDAMLQDTKLLLDALGVPWVQAPCEGESQAAYMAKKGEVYAAGSQDYDALLFGTPVLIRNLTLSGKRKLPRKNVYVEIPIESISLEKTLANLGINRKQLVAIGLLVGTDFCPGIKGIGPKKALKLVKESKSFKNVFSEVEWNAEAPPEVIADIFLKPDVTDKYKLEWKKPNLTQLIKFMCDEHDFSEERVKKAVEGAAPDSRQQSLGAFFK